MSSLFSSTDCSADAAFSRLPFGEEVSKSIPLGPESNKYNSSNYSQTYRNRAYSEKLIDSIHPDLNTHAKLFNHAAKVYANRPCLGARPYDYLKKKLSNHYE